MIEGLLFRDLKQQAFEIVVWRFAVWFNIT
ncbi:hypothetical protein DSW25_01350 [Sulfitobacter donghicola DSW-25 = KCTC 12864 = JCM 14565]|uniref:Uncharacterized protein n=1 Tax=Sulfitobacter donghicola DSW-25 = KCTC 12864 = JCM 14565 TaxID=1300350 RepID=A0A073J091_9RHOB|nr:hypothetical protein DSW25_01350 [Sulfitobacter donghicola DSW-25 = KCTC 12864 = JCM 14565]